MALQLICWNRNNSDFAKFEAWAPPWAHRLLTSQKGREDFSSHPFHLVFAKDLAKWLPQWRERAGLISCSLCIFVEEPPTKKKTVKKGANESFAEQLPELANLFLRVVISPKDDFSGRSFWTQMKQELQLSLNLRRVVRSQKDRSITDSANTISSLQNRLQEQTVSIMHSHDELKSVIEKERRQSVFLSKLLASESFETVLNTLRRELFSVKDLVELHWLQVDRDQEILHMSYHHGQWQSKITPFLGSFSEVGLESHRAEWSRFLSRPVGFFFPIRFRDDGHQKELREACLVLEVSSPESFDKIVNAKSDFIDYAKLSWVRFGLESIWSSLASRWKKTYESFHDPLVFIDSQFKIVMSNRDFAVGEPCHKVLFSRAEPCEGCPLVESFGVTDHKKISHPTDWIEVSTYEVIPDVDQKKLIYLNHYQNLSREKALVADVWQLEKMADLGVLAESLGHEINNPLTGILGLVQLILADTPPEKAELRSDLDEIQRAVERSQRVIRALMDFAVRKSIDKRAVRIDEIIENTMPLMKTLLRPHRTRIELDAGEAKVFAETSLLQQVIFNLVQNACQAMKNPGEVTIASECSEAKVMVRISDTGPGIPKDIQAQIFRPFFTTKKQGQGTGIGLDFVKKVVNEFGGDVFFTSQEGQGTEFCLEFPRQV